MTAGLGALPPAGSRGRAPGLLPLRLALRDLRGGWRGLRIVLACLALGVAAIATVGGLRAAVEGGLAAHGRTILGGDLEISGGYQPLPAKLEQWLAAHGAQVSHVAQLRSMLIAANGERQLVELKAVDRAWPLVGRATVNPPQPIAQAETGVLVEPLILSRLNIHVGDSVRLGNLTLPIRGVLTNEPDHAASPSVLGPRALIALSLLPQTGLVQPGSMVDHLLRITWPAGANTTALTHALRAEFPDNGWRIRDPQDAVPGANQFIDQLAVFLSLIGLTSLLVGGIGVATGVRAWLDGRARSIAIVRCLGASARLVFTIALAQVAMLSALGVAIGVAVGAVLPLAALSVFGDALPVPPRLGVYPGPLALSALFGALTALTFALLPLGRAMRIPGAALFRDTLLPSKARPPALLLLADLALGATLVALVVLTSPDRRLAFGFCIAALVTLGIFRLGGSALMAAARSARRLHGATLRLGLGNLHRPGNATPLMLMAVGLGLSTLAAVALTEGNLSRQIQGRLPHNAPSFYFIDIQSSQLATFNRAVATIPGAAGVEQMPYMPTRVTAVNGVPAAKLHPSASTAWALRGGRGLALTYAAAPPAGTKLVAGHWWKPDYSGPPLLSFDAKLASGWGVKLGDTITVNLLGRPITMQVASLRDIDWSTLSMNFAMVASPGLLSSAPQTHLATVRVPTAQQGPLLRAVTDALPNVTGIRVADVIAYVATLLGQIGAALAATSGLTLAAGALVLAGAVASGQRRRIGEAVILKSLGATRRQIRSAWLIEFGALGLAAGLLAAAIGAGASYAVMHWVMKSGWSVLPWRLGGTILGCVALMLALGYAGTEAALRAKAAPLLRND
jgi:putative ABC transport system permease protein